MLISNIKGHKSIRKSQVSICIIGLNEGAIYTHLLYEIYCFVFAINIQEMSLLKQMSVGVFRHFQKHSRESF